MARKMAMRLPTWFVAEDLLGPAEIGLITAASRYDPKANDTFRAYAIRRVKGACIDSIRRREYKERAHESLDIDGPCEDGPVDRAADPGPLPDELAAKAELKLVWDAVGKLPMRHRRVVKAIYRDGLPMAGVAERVGLRQSRVAQIHRQALEMLREPCQGLKAA